MCGILAALLGDPDTHVNQLIVDGLTVLQHRGQGAPYGVLVPGFDQLPHPRLPGLLILLLQALLQQLQGQVRCDVQLEALAQIAFKLEHKSLLHWREGGVAQGGGCRGCSNAITRSNQLLQCLKLVNGCVGSGIGGVHRSDPDAGR